MLKFLPRPIELYSQFWFLEGNTEFFLLEDEFGSLDFVYIQHTLRSEDRIEELFLFLYRIHNNGAKWLVLLNNSSRNRDLFTEYNLKFIEEGKLILVTNYPLAC
jgi:ubiquinone/menaquinone biosynthesis C-methylase UbiE